MDYIKACSAENLSKAAQLFRFPLSMQEQILELKEEIFADPKRLQEFLERCELLYERPDFDQAELKKWPPPREIGSMYYYLMLLAGAEEIERRMERIAKKRNVPHSIIEQTIYDIASDVNDYTKRTAGMPATSLGFRLNVNYGGEYFRFGRLALHLNRFQGGLTIYQEGGSGAYAIVDNATQLLVDERGYLSATRFENSEEWQIVISPEHKVLDVHIPGGAAMDMDESLESLRQGLAFFKKTFPEEQFEYFACFSWLMDARLPLLLSPESNIVRFQRMFRLFPDPLSANKELFINIFGFVPPDYDLLPEDTSLKRSLAKLLRSGTLPDPGGGGGFLSLADFIATYGNV